MASYASNLPALRKLAVPAVCVLIAFLAYSSQLLFHYLEPGPLSRKETIWFNSLVACIWWSYERACRVDPGRLPRSLADGDAQDAGGVKDSAAAPVGNWCRKCKAVKPPRAHHCRQCNRCIPKMDHHCPWTANCVSHTTFPHFLRFLLSAVLSLSLLASHLCTRISHIYAQRNLPSHLGPSMPALAHLTALTALTSLTLFALTVLLVSALNSLATNTTMIETWEIARHASLVARARRSGSGGYLHARGGRRVRVRHQEFPYDVGVWPNIVQGMGSANPIAWLLPFAGGPTNDEGWAFPVNGFEDADVAWPPPDPDRMDREPERRWEPPRGEGLVLEGGVEAFRARQREDYRRRGLERGERRVSGAPGSYEWLEIDESEEEEEEEGYDGDEGWADSQGGRLRDFGVDEDAELVGGPPPEEDDSDDDIPLGELLRRRRGRAQEA